VVAARTARKMAQQLRRALRLTRIAELRLDYLESREELWRFLFWLARHRPGCPMMKLPTRLPTGPHDTTYSGSKRLRLAAHPLRATLVATLRTVQAGGRFTGHSSEPLAFLAAATMCGCDWCDIEEETLPGPLLRLGGFAPPVRLLISVHDFRRTPRNLAAMMRRLKHCGGDAIKIATQCHSIRDSLRVLALARSRRNIVAVPMGEIGLPGRVLALRAGSALAYAPVEQAVAPGQVSLDEMKKLFRADQLDRRTRVYGVIGDPVGHSLSPLMHNTGFQARRMNAVYLPFLVRALDDFLAAIGPLGIAGFSVTLPHKERILRYLDDCDSLAAQIGAVNTVVVRGSGKLYGYNTDYVGVLRALERRVRLRASRVLLYGAGGAARAVAFALAQGGAVVCVCARRHRRAQALARAVGGEAVKRGRLRREFFDAIVNATSVGMHPRARQSPLRPGELNARLVMDLIYRPRKTRLLELAERRGIETVSGVEMFVAQGTAQWEIWTGLRAPVAAMRRVVLAALRREEAQAGR